MKAPHGPPSALTSYSFTGIVLSPDQVTGVEEKEVTVFLCFLYTQFITQGWTPKVPQKHLRNETAFHAELTPERDSEHSQGRHSWMAGEEPVKGACHRWVGQPRSDNEV